MIGRNGGKLSRDEIRMERVTDRRVFSMKKKAVLLAGAVILLIRQRGSINPEIAELSIKHEFKRTDYENFNLRSRSNRQSLCRISV